jgi:ATP/maltotriose-dependent transcriptional regulator MalT
MHATVRQTKLHVPSARATLVERLRLLEQLNALKGPGQWVALISASAGSGKTTLAV